jgi:type II secretory pathway pseudopilin PulG
MLTVSRRDRGDTIIEVLFAVTIFSLVAIGGLSLMNQGTAMAQRALEIGLVRQQIDQQVDALKYLNQSYVADYGKRGTATTQWKTIIEENAVDRAQDFNAMVNDGKCVLPSTAGKAFALDINKLNANPRIAPTVEDTETYARVRNDASLVRAEGLWIQAVRSQTTDGRPGAYDFHIRACWTTPGQATPMTLGTIVRLYEPRG